MCSVEQKLDLLVIAAHPDDAEIAMGGTTDQVSEVRSSPPSPVVRGSASWT